MNGTSDRKDALRLAVFASGVGSNFQAILDAKADGRLAADVVLCVSNKADAGALSRADSAGIPTAVLASRDFESPHAYSQALLKVLDDHGVNFIALAGYLKLIPETLIQRYRNRILNVHPALLPAFGGPGMYGLKVHRAAIDHGVRWTGATVHIVDEHYDTGPIVLQKPVPVLQSDTAETLAARVLEVEHYLYPQALQLFAERRVRVEGRRAFIEERSVKSLP